MDLRLADPVGGTGRECNFSAPLGDELMAPAANAYLPRSSPSAASIPALAAIGRDFHHADAIAAVPSDSADHCPPSALTRAPSTGLVMSEFNDDFVIGVVVSVSWDREVRDQGEFPIGIR